MKTAEGVTALLSVAALALSLISLYVTRVFSRQDLRRDRAFEIIAEHHRTALALQAGDRRDGRGSRDCVEHLRRSQVQLAALGYDSCPSVPLAFLQDHRRERCVAVTRYIDLDRTDIGDTPGRPNCRIHSAIGYDIPVEHEREVLP